MQRLRASLSIVLLIGAALPAGGAVSLQNRQRAIREQLLREESARLLEARYQAATGEAAAAAARGDFAAARKSLLEGLRIKPRDPAALTELERVDAAIAAETAWNERVSFILDAMRLGDWQLAEHAMQQLPQPSPQLRPSTHGELVAAFRMWAAGRVRDARRSAVALWSSGRDPSAADFLRFVGARERAQVLPAGAAAVAGIYVLALLSSLYFGLRGAYRRAAAG